MVKYLKYFLLLIPFIFITNVNAAQYNHDAFTAQLYDNRGGSLIASSTSDTGASYYGVLDLTGYGTGGAWGISSPTILLANHTYVLTANISLGSSNLALSSINRIGLGTTLEDARVSYQNNTYAEELYSRVVGTDLVQFAFKSSINGSYIVFPFTSTSSTQTDIFLSYVNFEDLGEGGLSQTDITNSLNSQTNNINNNSNQNRDAIINNQEQNTQDIIDSNKENFQTCHNNYFNIMNVGYTSTSTGTVERTGQQVLVVTTTSNRNDVVSSKKLSDVAPNLVVGQSYRLSYKMNNSRDRIYLLGSNYAWVNNTDRVITQADLDSYVTFYTSTMPSTGYYSEIMIQKSDNISSVYIPYGEKCSNKLDDMIQNNEQNTQDIIDNQNQNTQQEIESQKVCYTSLPFKLTKGKAFNNDGSIINTNSYYYTSDYILVPPSSTIQFNVSNFQSGSNNKIILYDENHTYIDYYSLNFSGKSFNTTSTTKYIRFSYLNNTGISITSSVPVCKNGNQALNDSVNDLNDSITSEDNPNTNQDIDDMNNMVASDTPISDLITMPLTLINAYINGVNSSCSPINLGNLYGTDLILPCINLEQRLGSNLWHIIDAFFSIFMCYNIGMLFITAFDGITSLRDDFEGLYQPRHADTGYQPKHGG